MKWKKRSIRELAVLICGDGQFFRYRSSRYLTEFFEDCGLEFVHDGSTRATWVAERLGEVLAQPHPGPFVLPEAFVRIIRSLLDKSDAQEGDQDRSKALAKLNDVLSREGWEAFYDELGNGQLRRIGAHTVAQIANPHRPLTAVESDRRNKLIAYLDECSEDELIDEVLMPLFRQLGFLRITAAGHKDRALEYGKDVWMKFTLPTQHVLYFGIQVKKGKIDAAAVGRGGSTNVSEIYNQAAMMLESPIFDPELNRQVLVDHALIVAGGEISKQAKNWLGTRLGANKRSQILFMDGNDILNLFVVNELQLPNRALQRPNVLSE